MNLSSFGFGLAWSIWSSETSVAFTKSAGRLLGGYFTGTQSAVRRPGLRPADSRRSIEEPFSNKASLPRFLPNMNPSAPPHSLPHLAPAPALPLQPDPHAAQQLGEEFDRILLDPNIPNSQRLALLASQGSLTSSKDLPRYLS